MGRFGLYNEFFERLTAQIANSLSKSSPDWK